MLKNTLFLISISILISNSALADETAAESPELNYIRDSIKSLEGIYSNFTGDPDCEGFRIDEVVRGRGIPNKFVLSSRSHSLHIFDGYTDERSKYNYEKIEISNNKLVFNTKKYSQNNAGNGEIFFTEASLKFSENGELESFHFSNTSYETKHIWFLLEKAINKNSLSCSRAN